MFEVDYIDSNKLIACILKNVGFSYLKVSGSVHHREFKIVYLGSLIRVLFILVIISVQIFYVLHDERNFNSFTLSYTLSQVSK